MRLAELVAILPNFTNFLGVTWLFSVVSSNNCCLAWQIGGNGWPFPLDSMASITNTAGELSVLPPLGGWVLKGAFHRDHPGFRRVGSRLCTPSVGQACWMQILALKGEFPAYYWRLLGQVGLRRT